VKNETETETEKYFTTEITLVQYRDDLTGPEYKVGVLGGENLNKDIQ